MCFICACMEVTTQLELCLHEQTQLLASAACRVGSQQFLGLIANYLFPFLTFYFNPYFFKFIYVIYIHGTAQT